MLIANNIDIHPLWVRAFPPSKKIVTLSAVTNIVPHLHGNLTKHTNLEATEIGPQFYVGVDRCVAMKRAKQFHPLYKAGAQEV